MHDRLRGLRMVNIARVEPKEQQYSKSSSTVGGTPNCSMRTLCVSTSLFFPKSATFCCISGEHANALHSTPTMILRAALFS